MEIEDLGIKLLPDMRPFLNLCLLIGFGLVLAAGFWYSRKRENGK